MPTTMAIDPAVSGSLCARSPSVSAAHPSTTRLSAPDACESKYPSDACIRRSTARLRMFDAQRNAARCVHMRPAKYRAMLSAPNASAHHPYAAIPVAALQSGAAAIRSRATSQMHTYGPKPASIEAADRAQPRYVRALRGPAKSSSLATAPLFLGETSFSMDTSVSLACVRDLRKRIPSSIDRA